MRVLEIVTQHDQIRYLLLDDAGMIIEPVVAYLKHLDKRGYARNTLATYATGLKWYWEFLADACHDWNYPTLDTLADFINWLRAPGISSSHVTTPPLQHVRSSKTINSYLSIISGFYDYHHRIGRVATPLREDTTIYLPDHVRGYIGFLHGIADERPVAKHILKQPENRRDCPPTISREQLCQLRLACTNRRDCLLVGLLYETAMRIGEALSLWVEDIDMAELVIEIHDRGRLSNNAEIKTTHAERRIYVSETLMHEIVRYVAQAHTSEVETNHLFLKQHGVRKREPLEYRDVDALFRRLRQKTGVSVTPHTLRHTMLTALAEEGWAPELLQQRAGHASFQYTYQTYIHPSSHHLRREWERVSTAVEVPPLPERGGAR